MAGRSKNENKRGLRRGRGMSGDGAGVARELMCQKGMSSGWQGNERNHPLERQETPLAEPAVSQELVCSWGEERKDR